MSVSLYGIDVWGAAYQRKYLDRIDRFLKRTHRFGFITKKTTILDLIKDRDSKLFKNVIRDDHILHDLLPPKRRQVLREHKHDSILPNASSIVSSMDTSLINFTVYKVYNEFYNVTHFCTLLINIFFY